VDPHDEMRRELRDLRERHGVLELSLRAGSLALGDRHVREPLKGEPAA
jgi:hypothetical protein